MSAVPRLHLIGPLNVVTTAAYLGIARRAASGGCDAVHLRVHDFRGGDLLRMARSFKRELAGFSGTRVIVNDRADVALLADVDGLQLGERSFEIAEARVLVGDRLMIGRSVHDLDGASSAEAAGADYLLAGHIYDTPSKQGQPGRGLDWLTELVSNVTIPVVAIGGVTVERAPEVLAAGAWGVAMGRELLEADDPAAIARVVTQYFDRIGGDDE